MVAFTLEGNEGLCSMFAVTVLIASRSGKLVPLALYLCPCIYATLWHSSTGQQGCSFPVGQLYSTGNKM